MVTPSAASKSSITPQPENLYLKTKRDLPVKIWIMFQIVKRSEYLTRVLTGATKFSFEHGFTIFCVSGSTDNSHGFYLYYQTIRDGKVKAVAVCVLASFFGASVGVV